MQAPDPGLSKFHAVAGGIANIERAPSAWPFELGLNGDGAGLKALAPAVKFGRQRAKTNVPGTVGAMRRHRQSAARLCGGMGIENQEHLIAAFKEHVAAIASAVRRPKAIFTRNSTAKASSDFHRRPFRVRWRTQCRIKPFVVAFFSRWLRLYCRFEGANAHHHIASRPASKVRPPRTSRTTTGPGADGV